MGRALLAAGPVAATAAMAIVVACSSFDEAEGAPDGAPPDAATSAEGGTPEAGSDAQVPPWVPCAMRQPDPAHFCDDFDHGAPNLIYKWTYPTILGGGTIGESTAASSLPLAFASRTTAATQIDGLAYLRYEADPGANVSMKSQIALSFAMRVDAPPYAPGAVVTNSYTHLAVLRFDEPACFTSGGTKQRHVELSFEGLTGALAITVKGLQVDCADSGSDFVYKPTPLNLSFFSDRQFHRFRIAFSRTPCPNQGGSSVKVAIEGAPVEQCIPLGVDPFSYAKTTNFSIELGVQARGPQHDATQFTYDNVAWDFD